MSIQKKHWLIVAYCLLLFSSEGWAHEDSPNSLGQIGSSLTVSVAIVTAITGAITGIAGSIMGYVAYRRSNEMKKSDRRLDLHKLTNDVHTAGTTLLEILQEALTSHKAMSNARGMFHSSTMTRFATQHEKNSKRATELSNQIPTPAQDANYDSMSLQQLERELVRLDKIGGEVDQRIGKYRDSIEQDQNYRIHR